MSRVLNDEEISEHAIVCWPVLQEHERRSFQLVAQTQRDLSDRETAQEIFGEIEKSIKWTEKHYAPGRDCGTPESTGGIINIGEEYCLVPKEVLQALKAKYLVSQGKEV